MGVAVKTTLVPAEMLVPGFAAIETLAVIGVETFITAVLDVAGFPEIQAPRFDVRIQVT